MHTLLLELSLFIGYIFYINILLILHEFYYKVFSLNLFLLFLLLSVCSKDISVY